MDNSYLRAILNSTTDIIGNLSTLSVTLKEQLTPSNEDNMFDNTLIVLNIKGDIDGKIVFVFTTDVLYKLAAKVSKHTLDTEINFKEDEESLIAMLQEIANEISGQAITLLNINGLNCEISVPEVVLSNANENEKLSCDNLYEKLLILSTEIGDFKIFLTTEKIITRNPAILCVNMPYALVENIALGYITKGIEVFNTYTFGETLRLLEQKVFDFVIMDIDRLTVNFKVVWDELIDKSQNKQLQLVVVSARTKEQTLNHIVPIKPLGYLNKYQHDHEIIKAVDNAMIRTGLKSDKVKKHIKVHIPQNTVYTEIVNPHNNKLLKLSLNDISILGMACYVHSVIDDTLKMNDEINEVRLYLKQKDFVVLKGQLVAINKETQQIVIRFKGMNEKTKKTIATFIFKRNAQEDKEGSIFKDTAKQTIQLSKELLVDEEEKIIDLNSNILFIAKDLQLAKLMAKQLSSYGIKIIHEQNIFRSMMVVKKIIPKIVMISNQISKNEVYSFLARLRHDIGYENLPAILTIDETLPDKTTYSEEEMAKLKDIGLTEVVDTTDKQETFVKTFTNSVNTPTAKYGQLFFDDELAKKYNQIKALQKKLVSTDLYEVFLKSYKTVIKIEGVLPTEKVNKLKNELELMKDLSELHLEFVIKLDNIPYESLRRKKILTLFSFLPVIEKYDCPVNINIINSNSSSKLDEILSKQENFPQYKIYSNMDECMVNI